MNSFLIAAWTLVQWVVLGGVAVLVGLFILGLALSLTSWKEESHGEH